MKRLGLKGDRLRPGNAPLKKPHEATLAKLLRRHLQVALDEHSLGADGTVRPIVGKSVLLLLVVIGSGLRAHPGVVFGVAKTEGQIHAANTNERVAVLNVKTNPIRTCDIREVAFLVRQHQRLATAVCRCVGENTPEDVEAHAAELGVSLKIDAHRQRALVDALKVRVEVLDVALPPEGAQEDILWECDRPEGELLDRPSLLVVLRGELGRQNRLREAASVRRQQVPSRRVRVAHDAYIVVVAYHPRIGVSRL